jgi:hypothetical protein
MGLGAKAQIILEPKIKGVNFVSPKLKSKLRGLDSIKNIHANWIAICPFAFLYENSSTIEYNTSKNWWGDNRMGLIEQIKKAKLNRFKVLVKPHFWLMNAGWAGDFNLTGKTKIEWENNYETYLIYLARLCDSLDVEMLSIGTELKTYTSNHPEFFGNLITEIRKVFKGKLTYAANWDEYENIKFWNQLDYIGVDAYFPLSESKTPEIIELEKKWKEIGLKMKNVNLKFNKKIVFTEYGYKSIDFAANKQWEFENTPKTEDINFISQTNAYTALYNSIWKEDFVAGGFIWKWYNDYDMRKDNSDYTPQRKPVMKVIKNQYSLN